MTAIPKSHPLLTRSANTMLRDCRQILARQIRLKRKIERAGGAFEVETLKSPFVAYTKGEKR